MVDGVDMPGGQGLERAGFYQKRLFPLLMRLDAEKAHDLTLSLLGKAQRSSTGRAVLRRLAGVVPRQEVPVMGLTFPNVLGVAAGFDKEVSVARGLAELGFGHIEVGTITPEAQPGNAKPRVFRLPEDLALINRMGFPNAGLHKAVARLGKLAQEERDFVVGISIGKQKETALVDAVDDYLTILASVYVYGDYFAINISSPNTPELRKLQHSDYLRDLLQALVSKGHDLAEEHGVEHKPLLVKIAPDLTWAELDAILETVLEQGIDGIIATNTTLSRQDLTSANRVEQGGLSGAPLTEMSTRIIHHVARSTGGKLPIIGVGGVFGAADVAEKLAAGASLVQLYTGLIYEGPGIAGRILRELAK